jgi:outer membrane protein
LSRATAERVGAEGVLEQSRAVYRNVVGELPGKLVRPPVPQDLPKSLQESIERSIGANPTIAAVEYDERTALDVVDSVRGELLPTVSLIGSAEQIWEENREGVRLDDLQATVRVTVPIYQSGVVYSRLRESKQVVAEQRKLLDQARRDAVESATTAWSALETARAQLVSLTKEVEANTVALEGVQREAEVGARTVLDILDAEQELLDSQVRLVGAERDEVVASYQLKSALGELTARRLGLQVDFYDPDRHYNEVRNRWFGGCSEGDICTDFNAPASAD